MFSIARRDPITGEELGKGETEQLQSEDKEIVEGAASVVENRKAANGDASEPHLGPVRNSTGIRCAQPPGGRSTVTFG